MRTRFAIRNEFVFAICIMMSIGLAVLTFVLSNAKDSEVYGISNLKAYSKDKEIYLKWDSAGEDGSELRVMSTDGRTIDTVDLHGTVTSYSFTHGEHGTKYVFSVSRKEKNEYIGPACEQTALFLDYNSLPDFPVVSVETRNEEIPTYTVVDAPPGCWGQGITDNEYIAAKITLTARDSSYITTGNIRVRGNTSATMVEKKPYKIKLDHAIDLLGRENDKYADTEWILIACDYSFETISGMTVSELCGLGWQPQFITVNLMLNGNWLGCYYLFEDITVGQHRLNLGENGFLIENDAYWWNEEVYFKTPYQMSTVAYTFKHPNSKLITPGMIATVRSIVSAYERDLTEMNSDYLQHIDVNSLASWLLVHDILGTWDAGGSNMYLHKYDMSAEGKLIVGPAWDFNSVFMQKDQWAVVHNSPVMHYDLLLKDSDFLEVYKKEWNKKSNTIVSDVLGYLDTYVKENGVALQESWLLDAARYDFEAPQVEDALTEASNWFETRKVWLDEEIRKLES